MAMTTMTTTTSTTKATMKIMMIRKTWETRKTTTTTVTTAEMTTTTKTTTTVEDSLRDEGNSDDRFSLELSPGIEVARETGMVKIFGLKHVTQQHLYRRYFNDIPWHRRNPSR